MKTKIEIIIYFFILLSFPLSGSAQNSTATAKGKINSSLSGSNKSVTEGENEMSLEKYWSNLDSLFVNYDWESMNQFAERVRTRVEDIGIHKVSGGKVYYKKEFLQNRLTVDLERSINAKKSGYNFILEYQLKPKLFLRGESIRNEIRNSSNINIVIRQDY